MPNQITVDVLPGKYFANQGGELKTGQGIRHMSGIGQQTRIFEFQGDMFQRSARVGGDQV